MSHIKKAVGRPAAAGRAGDEFDELDRGSQRFERSTDISKGFANEYGVEASSAELVWRVPLDEVAERIQTVGGIAEIAKCSRKTIYRLKIRVGGFQALGFLIEEWRGTGRPLVKHKDPMHPLNFGRRLKPPYWVPCTVLDVVAACQSYFENGTQTVKTLHLKPGNPLHERANAMSEQKRQPGHWKRKHKISPPVDAEFISDKDLSDFLNRKRLGQIPFYRPQGRVTVKMLCSKFSIPRREFYRWKAGLLIAERKLLESAMAGKFSKQLSGGDVVAKYECSNPCKYGEPHYEFDSAEEIDKRLGWKEPSEG